MAESGNAPGLNPEVVLWMRAFESFTLFMKVKINNAQYILDNDLKVVRSNNPLKVLYLLKKSKKHIGWINMDSIGKGREIILIERKQ